MNRRHFWARLSGAYSRRSAKWFGRKVFTLRSGEPLISFTFDDFPQSAFEIGASILEQYKARGTFYTSRGLAGQTGPTGRIYSFPDLPALLSRGHELGCHTYHHCPAWETSPREYIASVDENASALAGVLGTGRLETHSYPINYPRPATKRRLQTRFRACRGGGQTFNSGRVDLNYLNSFFLEQSRDHFPAVEQMIAASAVAGGWLVFSTHDVSESPTRFGCNPTFFAKVVHAAVRSGSKILPMSAALDVRGVERLR